MTDRLGFGIIALAPNDWQGQWVNRQQLLSRLGRRWPIVYSNGAWTIWERGSKEWRRAPVGGRFYRLNDVWVDAPPRWLMRWPRFGVWDQILIRRQARRLRRQLAVAGAKRRIAYICHPIFLPYLKHLDAELLVYHAYDLFDSQPGWTPAQEASERELLRRADFVCCPSEALAEALALKVARPIHVLLNAADVPVFLAAARAPAPEPSDLAPIACPRIGYLGSLHPQLDYSLIRALAERRPGHHWVLIGPRLREKDLLADGDFQALLRMRNVHMLDSKGHDEVPAYTVNMNVNVMIYKSTQTSWTRVAYPLKLHEYLASGRPIVTMDLPMLYPLSHVIRFARGIDDWLAALDEALLSGGTGTPAQRQAAAAEHSWDARSHELESCLLKLVREPMPGEPTANTLSTLA
jgi:hypothetical protein